MGKQLSGKPIVVAVALPLNCNNSRIAWHQIGSPARIVAILRNVVAARVPVGYEDESGFHYGVAANDWFFSI